MRIESCVLKAVERAASRELGRYAIDGVHVKSDGSIEATDGRMLLAAKGEIEKDETFKTRIVARESVRTILADPLTKRLKVANVASNGKVTFWGSAGESPVEYRDCDFPDTKGVVPPDERIGFRVSLSGHLLAAIAAAAKDVDPDAAAITFEFQNDTNGALDACGAIRLGMGDGPHRVTGVVMPMSL